MKIETRKDEVRIITSNPKEMLHKFTANRILKKWTEDFIDEVTGEVVSIERNEILFNKALLIDEEILSQIQFYIQAGDISAIEVSNQRRAGVYVKNTYLKPFIASVIVDDKKIKLLFYSSGVETAILVLKDFIELNYSGGFTIRSISDFSTDIVLVDNLTTQEEYGNETEEPKDKKFYQIEFTVEVDDILSTWKNTAIVHTISVDRAMMLITDYLQKNEQRRIENNRKDGMKPELPRTLVPVLEAAKPIVVNEFIPREFSEAYEEVE